MSTRELVRVEEGVHDRREERESERYTRVYKVSGTRECTRTRHKGVEGRSSQGSAETRALRVLNMGITPHKPILSTTAPYPQHHRHLYPLHHFIPVLSTAAPSCRS